MTTTRYLVYDVFTETAFGGNPLAVIVDAAGVPEENLQRIAREFNFSETTFVYPPEDPAHDAKVRIFTPTMEIPFAGHPTVGTSVALRELGRAGEELTLELGVGPISVRASKGRARFVVRQPLQTWDGPDAELVGRSIGQASDVVRTDRHPPVIASVGLPFAIAELMSMEALDRAEPVTEVFKEFDPMWPADTHYDLLVYVRRDDQIAARMFAPLDGIPEDPATGSAAAALSAFLGQLDKRSARFEITQGVQMGRPSRIDADVTVEGGETVSVGIGGHAIKVMEGHIVV